MTIWQTPQQLSRIQQLQQTGNLVEAEVACRQALLGTPDAADLLDISGVILSQLGKNDEALGLLTRAVSIAPSNHIFAFNLGTVNAALGKYGEAEACFRKVLAMMPSLPEGFYNLGNALKDQRKLEDAVAAYRKALQLRSSYPAAWSNLGATYIELTKLADAKMAIQRALSLNQKSPSALNNFASILRIEGDLPRSVEFCLSALTINPNYAEAYFTLGSALIASLDYQKAIIAYEKGAALKPTSKGVMFELVNAYGACGLHEGIVRSLRRLLELDPNDARAEMFLGITQMERGFYDEARQAFQRSLSLADDAAARIRFALTVPPILSSAAEIATLRQDLDFRLDALLAQSGKIDDPYAAQLGTNFFLAYHGVNDRDIQKKIARVYREYAPSLNFVAPHCGLAIKAKPRIKVGFVSKFIYRHSVAISFGRVVTALSKLADFELYLISTTDHTTSSVKEMYSEYEGNFACIPASLPYSQQAIASLELDTLIYLDLGMDPLTFLMAFARLAPVQCVLGGHPDTTGIDTVDYYLSAGQVEPANAEEHYSEKLVRMSSGGYSLSRPELPSQFKTRADLGLPTEGSIYFCPMMLQKLHPDFDATISRILELDPTGHVVLCESFQHPHWGHLIRERLDKAVNHDVRPRVVFIPWIANPEDFMSAISVSSVILDPYHFGIGTTGVHTITVGTPIVTLPGKFLRGRVGLLYSELLDVTECVAASAEDYAQKAVEIATNPVLRDKLRQKILANNNTLFEKDDAATELAAFIRATVGQLRTDSHK